MQFVAAGVIWAGYSLIYWGYCRITGPRGGSDMSFGMLMKPAKLTLAKAWMKQPHAGTRATQGNFDLIPNANPNQNTSAATPGGK